MVNKGRYRFFTGWKFRSWGEALASLGLLVIGCAAAIILVLAVFCGGNKQAYAYEDTVTYFVEQGDTLWTIARRYSTEKQDVRRVIDIIEEINDCSSSIYPGDALDIPVFTDTLGR